MAVIKKQQKKMRRTIEGVVVSDKMMKTRVVAVTRLRKHAKYQRYYKVTMRFKAHDEQNATKTGDKVNIRETRPMSRDKRWEVVFANNSNHQGNYANKENQS